MELKNILKLFIVTNTQNKNSLDFSFALNYSLISHSNSLFNI